MYALLRPGYISFDTRYYISNKKIVSLSKHAYKRVVLPQDIFGGRVKYVAEFLKKDATHIDSEQVVVAGDSVEMFCEEWLNWLKTIGMPFFRKYSDIEQLDLAFNQQPPDEFPPLVLSGANRVIRGSIISVFANSSQNKTNDLLEKYDAHVKSGNVNHGLPEDFQAIKEIILNLKDRRLD